MAVMARASFAQILAIASLATACSSTTDEGASRALGARDDAVEEPMRPTVEVTPPSPADPRAFVAMELRARVAPRSVTAGGIDTVACPDGAPFVCPAPSARGWECRERACPPSCERVGCPSMFRCIDCGTGAECMPRDHACR